MAEKKMAGEKTCPPCRLLVMVGVAGELAVELELLLEERLFEIFVNMCKKFYHFTFV